MFNNLMELTGGLIIFHLIMFALLIGMAFLTFFTFFIRKKKNIEIKRSEHVWTMIALSIIFIGIGYFIGTISTLMSIINTHPSILG